ncbi:MAG TPA: peptide chain release factor N(5)-glutamine methyltransferase [Solirubrobacterales bacterium]|nr:peptide chain release factor N(5)-glutamine methyltransferase [Solirubrobacterales bacterium]
MPGNTVRDALEAAVDALNAAGCETARLDAEVLLGQATGWDRAHLAAEPEARLPVGASREFGEMVRRRVRREPVAYILGRKGFRRIELIVDRRVLIPRPETELLVDLALEVQPSRVLDVGTGSGAIALAVADELDGASVTAVDTSFDAVRVAQANTERLGLSDRVDVVLRGPSALSGAEPDGRPVDLLLANLPYVSDDEWDELAPEIREYEPREALVPGATGLEAIEALAEELFGLAPRPSIIALEIGAQQADEVTRLIRATGYEQTEVRQDLAGLDRMVVGR